MSKNDNGTTASDRPLSRRSEIAKAARALIAERGLEGLRTRDIADRVGINIATLHYHVPSKQSLIELVAEFLRDEFHAQHEARPRANLTPLEQLRLEFLDFRQSLTGNAETFLVMAELSEMARRDPKVAAVIRPMHRLWREMIAGIIEAGRCDGSFRTDIDPPAAATIVIGAMIGARRADEDIAYFDRVVSELERALIPAAHSSDGAQP